MANETTITIVGNLTDAPELRFTNSGVAVAKFRIASTPRKFDKGTSAWVDEQPLFLPCSVWREMAESVAESLEKGMRVIVQGRLKQRSYETKEGEQRTVYEVDVDEVGPSLRYATAKVQKVQKVQKGDRGSSSGQRQAPAANDPWASTGGGGFDSDPPF